MSRQIAFSVIEVVAKVQESFYKCFPKTFQRLLHMVGTYHEFDSNYTVCVYLHLSVPHVFVSF